MSLPNNINILKDYPNKYYIETGLWRSDSLALALEADCFEQYIGIDIDVICIDFAIDRFDLRNIELPIRLIVGNSAEELPNVLSGIDASATIFLDAHFQLVGEKPQNAFPLMKELEAIMLSDRQDHTIIIDDFLYMSHKDITGWSRNDIFQALRRINSHYKIELIGNPINENLCIATPK